MDARPAKPDPLGQLAAAGIIPHRLPDRRAPSAVQPAGDHTDKMTKLEKQFAQYLQELLLAKRIIAWRYEPLKLRLADATFYNIDFHVVTASGQWLIEVKGFWRDDARIKWKVAAEQFAYAFRFVAVTRGEHGWEFEIPPRHPYPEWA